MFVRVVLTAASAAMVAVAQSAATQYTIAYAGFAPLNAEIFLADETGANPKPFLPHPALDFNASFSRDGNWIVFTSQRDGSADIYRARVDGSGLQRLTDDPAFDDQAALSPDGRRVAFVSTRSGHAEIWMLEIASKRATNITKHEGGHFRPAWSRDGQWLAISSDRDSPRPKRPNGFELIQRTEIYVMRPDGSELRQVTRTGSYAGSPHWSADGKQIAFYTASFDDVIYISDPRRMRATTQIAVVDLASGKETVITRGNGEKWSPRWVSPDRLGYVTGGPESGIAFTSIAGAGTGGAHGEFNSPDWSPDGRRMVFYRDMGQNWPPVMETHSLDPRFRLLRTGLFPSFSPNADRVAFTTGFAAAMHNGLMVASLDGSNRWTIFDDLQRNTVAPAWSPKGDKIAFGVGGAFQGVLGVGRQISNIAIVSPDGSGFKQLTQSEGNENFPSWSPDGKRIVYRTQNAKGKGLRIVNVETGEIQVLTEGASNNDNFPSWSPVRDEITFSSDRDGDWEIYVIRADGTGLRRLTHLRGNDGHSTWSPDGEWIAFATGMNDFKDEMALHPHNPQSYGEIAVMRPDGSELHRLTDNPWEDATPRWSPVVANNKQ
jgi:Tol biopolymer transport system component